MSKLCGISLFVVVCVLLCGWSFSFTSNTNPTNVSAAAHFRRKHKNLMQPGAPVVPKYSVHGAIIVSDYDTEGTRDSSEASLKKQLLISARLKNFHQLASELPFPLTQWAAVVTGQCPLYAHGHKTERGLIWAHYRIFREFAFFDPILLSRLRKAQLSPMVVKRNKPLRTKGGLYVAYPNGTLVKNNQLFADNDIIVIFEDDAESAIVDMSTALTKEFKRMDVDLLFLGWCGGRTAHPYPLCAHAYALTRKAARKLVKYIEPCGRALDEQFVILARNKLLSWRRAYTHSYQNLNDKYRNVLEEKTRGLFRQNEALGSVKNGHRMLTVL